MRMLIAGGGTGGHLFPGIALAEELLGRQSGHQVLFVGTKKGIEAREVPRSGFELELIEVGQLKGKGVSGWIRGLLSIPRALWQSIRILRRSQPDVVVGVGGYASGPVLLAAWLLRYPTAVLEQNALPGMTNRVLGKLVSAVFVSFPEAARFFRRGKVQFLGNPVRKALLENFLRSNDREAHGQRVLVLGGSQGAEALNRLVPEAMVLLKERFPSLQVVHQAGERSLQEVQDTYAALGLTDRVEAVGFIRDMAGAYLKADAVVSRAGATTVAELSLCRKPAVLVPFPFAADNHQEVNARALTEGGAAIMIRQSELTPAGLASALSGILGDPARKAAMEQAAGRVSRPESAREICEACLELCSPQGGRRRKVGA